MSLEPLKPCRHVGCEEPRYRALSICRTHNNQKQRERYQARIKANPPPPRPKKVWCKDCIDKDVPEPMKRLPFSAYCLPHRRERDKEYYQRQKTSLGVLLADMTDEQRLEFERRQLLEEEKYQREWNAGMHRTLPEDV